MMVAKALAVSGCLLAVSAAAGVRINVDCQPGESSARILEAVRIAQTRGGGTVALADGDYHFHSDAAAKMRFHVSNHDQPDVRPVFLPFVGVTNVSVVARNAKFVMHGMGTAVLVRDSLGISFKGITIEWEKPFFAKAEIVGFEDGRTRVRFPARDKVVVEDGKLMLCGEDWKVNLRDGNVFDRVTHEMIERTADVGFDGTGSACGDGEFLIDVDLSKVGAGAQVGDVYVMRNGYRPHPIVCLDRAKDTVFENFVFRDGFGMGILAQRSENVVLRGGGCYPRDRNEYNSNTIDATHFSNCRGTVTVENCRFEGMMDDALNVHSTCLGIVAKPSADTIRCRYMHPQAIGFGVFSSGDAVRFIAGKTLENGFVGRVKSVAVHDEREISLELEGPIPPEYGVGDAVENADWQCAVVFRRNTIANNRARGVLFTTPKKIVCEGNLFDHVSGSAILLAGDAQGWYESGACEDLVVRNNRFRDCLTSVFQYCNGIVSIYPEVKDLKSQKRRYHRNVLIEDNDIETFDVPLLYARSAENVIWRNNHVRRHSRYRGWGRSAFEIVACENVVTSSVARCGNIAFVDPFIGTEGTGHCTPAATCPFGMVQPGPDTGNGSWKYCSGYQHSDRSIDGFSQTHLNGTGQPEMADFLMLPFCGEAVLRKSAFSSETERAAPGYYAVSLDEAKVDVEITATERVAHYRFKYKAERPRLLVDLQHFLWQEGKYSKNSTKGGGATFSADGRSMSGWREAKAYWPHHKVHFHATFSRPIAAKRMLEKDGAWEMAPRYVLDFDLKPGDELQVKMALSYSSEAGAERNLNAEDAAFDFDAIRARAEGKWQSLLGRVELESTTADQRKMFYTSLYHLCVQPNLISDVGERIRYSTFSLWDTYRAAHPLYTILFPEMVEPFLGSFLDHAKETGFMPIWEIYGKEGYDMIGSHSIPVVLDAYRKGFKVRLEDFYPYVRDTQTKDNRAAHASRDFEKCHWELYDRLGYFPYDVIAWGSLCRLMEVTFDDHCAAEMARELGKREDELFFRKRSGYWKNAFNPQTGYLAPRKTDGSWLKGYDPHWLLRKDEQGHVVGDTGEGSGLQWSFHVLHDFDGLVKAMGGRAEFLRRLDYLFSHRPFWKDRKEYTDRWPYRDASGLVGEYSHGNEPCHHIAYFYSLAGRRDKTAAIVGEIARTLYPVTADGMCGNDDCGQLGAWYVFAALGFYPVDPSSGEYVLGEPIVPSVTVKFPSGRRLRIRRDPGVEGVRFNGCAQDGLTVPHAALVRGGELVFGNPKGT